MMLAACVAATLSVVVSYMLRLAMALLAGPTADISVVPGHSADVLCCYDVSVWLVHEHALHVLCWLVPCNYY